MMKGRRLNKRGILIIQGQVTARGHPMVTLQARVAAAESNSEHASRADRQILALNMIRLRGMRGLSEDTLPLECGFHRTFIAHVQRQARNISLDNIERIATALGVSVAELLASPRFGAA